MTRSDACPQAIGGHGSPNTSGRCPYCGEQLTGRARGARPYRPGHSVQDVEHALRQHCPSGPVDETGTPE